MRWLALSVSAVLITACTTAATTRPAASGTSTPPPVARDSTAHSTAATSDHLRRTGRPQAELLRDDDFRVSFEDLRRLKVAVDFDEIQFGLLRVALGPGFGTVSSARYNLEHLYWVYRIASYRSEDTVIELWKNETKIGEVTAAGLRLGADSIESR